LEKERSGTGSVLDATRKSKIIFGVVAGMASLHARGVLYRDLKPDNIFLNQEFEPVIGDFGISRYCANDLNHTRNTGTPLFMAPECWEEDETYDFPVDVFPFAVTLYSLFGAPTALDDGQGAPRSAQGLLSRVSQGARFVRKPEIPDYHWSVIVDCWKRDPALRPEFFALLEAFHRGHEYILAGADRAAVLEYEAKVYSRFDPPMRPA
jgi:serine/threonine protein kinase